MNMELCSRLKSLSRGTDTGWCWFLCFLAALCNALHFGVSLSFGVVLPCLLEHFKESIDITAMVGSLAIAITFVATFPAAKLVDYFGLRAVTFLGGLISMLSLVLTSFAKSIIVLFFTYSIGFGIGASFLYTTSMFMSIKYFKRRRNIALGVVCAGGGSGYLAFGPILQLSLDNYGWKQSCRLMGALFGLPLLIALLYGSDSKRASREIDQQNSNSKLKKTSSKVFDGSILSNSLYTVSVASITLACLAHYVPQIYVVELCEKLGISSSKSSQLLIFIGLATLSSRLFAGILQNSPRVSTLCVFQSSLFLDAMAHLAISFAYKYEHFIAICILYGLADGGFSTSLNDLLLSTVKADQISSAFGFGCLVNSISVAAGAPLAGLLIKHFKSHNPAFFTGAAILLVSSILPCLRYCIVSMTSRRSDRPSGNLEVTMELCPDQAHTEHRPQIIAAQACEVSPIQLLVCKESVEKPFSEEIV